MRLLLDTHALIWWLNDSPKLSQGARAAMTASDNDVLVSAATAWEMATKVRRGKLPEAVHVVADFVGLLDREGFEPLPITLRHALTAGQLGGEHNDPFDRMIAAQTMIEGLQVVTIDQAIAALGAGVVW